MRRESRSHLYVWRTRGVLPYRIGPLMKNLNSGRGWVFVGGLRPPPSFPRFLYSTGHETLVIFFIFPNLSPTCQIPSFMSGPVLHSKCSQGSKEQAWWYLFLECVCAFAVCPGRLPFSPCRRLTWPKPLVKGTANDPLYLKSRARRIAFPRLNQRE